MAFSFNFDISSQFKQNYNNDTLNEKEEKTNQDTVKNQSQVKETSAPKKVKEAHEHKHAPDLLSHIENSVTETVTVGALPPLLYLNESVFEQTAPERDDAEKVLSQTITQNSDLITGVYEGGLKIWEGTHDLLEYVDDEGETFSGKRVLDLGCGAGLLGILALKRGASKVHFQDYNSTVIEQLTIPNVFLNCEEEGDDEKGGDDDGSPAPKQRSMEKNHALTERCSFFSGDWVSFLSLIQSQDPTLKYDLIFTSETIYNTDYYPSLHDVFHKLLAEHGLVYLATKSHYFGVGGGLYLFERFVEEKNVFQIKSLRELDQGLKRHIVSLRFKKSPS
ncbi:histidine protein methyltransferase 1 homolog [Pangasianodon hypophthalmus]|uniref:histidine protein methyltransferase 1 homolog n=1 Tax=Pangasianodon hypophthalmus TaxID=310915 RepID=UPI000EFE6A53|nr:histidine protein methyltransferase 1 homolog [Pangasianodon hypophthalmus]